LGRASGQVTRSDFVDPIDEESTTDEPGGQTSGGEFVVSHDVGNDIAHPPLATQAAFVPLLKLKACQEVCELAALVARHLHRGCQDALLY